MLPKLLSIALAVLISGHHTIMFGSDTEEAASWAASTAAQKQQELTWLAQHLEVLKAIKKEEHTESPAFNELVESFATITPASEPSDPYARLYRYRTMGEQFLRPMHKNSDDTVRKAFATLSLSNEEIINLLSREYPGLKKLFAGSAQVWEGYSIKEHTLMVYEQFDQLKKFFDMQQLNKDLAAAGITNNIERLLRVSIVVHDIGKSLGSKERQHEFTVPIFLAGLSTWGFTPKEISLALSLVEHDLVGKSVLGIIDVPQAFDELRQLACQNNLHIQTFFQLQELFYLSDASSYPAVRNRYMTQTRTGKLTPKSPSFSKLAALVNAHPKLSCTRMESHE